MKKIWLGIFCLIFCHFNYGQNIKTSLTDDEIRLKESLEKDSEFLQIRCRQLKEAAITTAKIRLEAYQAIKETDKQSKIKKTCGTIEGDPIYSYLMVENGKASFIIDTSKDEFGPKRVLHYLCGELNIGFYFFDEKERKMIFQKVENNNLNDPHNTVLQCISDNKELIF